MNKYYVNDNYRGDGIENQLMPDENMLWQGTPKKSAFVLNRCMHMMPFALIWLLFDSFFIVAMFSTEDMMEGIGAGIIVLIVFFALHLTPVWIWLFEVLTAGSRWKNTEYAITDKRVIIRNGLVGFDYQSFYYTELSNPSLHVGVIDRMTGVGDIIVHEEHYRTSKGKNRVRQTGILDIEEPQRVMALLQQTMVDVHSDIHYPNALRPEVNPGYRTEYRR